MDDLNDENLQKKPVVVLTRLPEFTLNALQPPTPQQFDSEAESHGSSDSDMLWEPGDDSGDSDFGVVFPPPSPAAEISPIIVSAAFASHSNETRNVRPDLPEPEIKLDMVVLARRRVTRWQRGKIVEIINKDDGRVKYKVIFDEKGKSLVSGHHIAKETTPKLDQLYVGARVLIQSPEDEQCFLPGLLSELPSRKNRNNFMLFRFLVFLDDHTPVYVSLPSLYLVCRQMDDPLGDLPESPHKCFMAQYLRSWPYPHLTHYKEGQILKIELNGVHQKCHVELVDCSLMKVVFEENGETDWIHRGSLRLEHMSKFLELKQNRGSKADDSDSK
uniref:Tudor domain-containing protein n=1 Tax=Poecilia formosa TaxID=48698 RepID=A0A096LSK7_POEFO